MIIVMMMNMAMIMNDYDDDGDVISCLLPLFEGYHLKLAFHTDLQTILVSNNKCSVSNSVAFLVGSI